MTEQHKRRLRPRSYSATAKHVDYPETDQKKTSVREREGILARLSVHVCVKFVLAGGAAEFELDKHCLAANCA